MQNVFSAAAVAAMCLFAAQAVLVLVRTPPCVRRSVPFLLSGFLLAMIARLVPNSGALLQEALLVLVLWSAGAFLIRVTHRRTFGQWTGAILALCFTLALARVLGYQDAVPYAALRAFGFALLAAIILGILFRTWRSRRSAAVLAALVAGCLWLLVGAVRAIGGMPFIPDSQSSGIPELVLSLSTGWLVFQEGYPSRAGWRGSLQSLLPREGLSESLYARLLATESALAWQERVTAAGFLALGAAHEFKNTLSHVRLASEHGLAQKDPLRKDECLRLILESAATGRGSAIDVLERISSSGGEALRDMEARDLSVTIRRAGSALRGEGIIITMDFETAVPFHARRFDIEQIVLNLIHNSAESYRSCPGEDEKIIAISARAEEEWAIIEVRDSAGGIKEGARHRLFTPSASGNGSSGLGLYLSRSLALANGGSLDYRPLDGGSAFRLALPAVERPGDS